MKNKHIYTRTHTQTHKINRKTRNEVYRLKIISKKCQIKSTSQLKMHKVIHSFGLLNAYKQKHKHFLVPLQ